MWRLAVIYSVFIAFLLHTTFCDDTLDAAVKSCQEKVKTSSPAISSLIGKSFSAIDTKYPTFSYEVGICKDPEDKITAARQIEAKTDSAPEVHSLGKIATADFMSGTNWVKMEYSDGDNYGHHCNGEGRRTVVLIICEESETEGHLELIEENKNKSAECYYLFELSHNSVCAINQPSGLGIGAIVSIVFFVAVGSYLLFGFLYQRFMLNARGKEQIPHYPFWQDVGNLAADGCNFVFRSDGKASGDRQYRGIGDDQLRPTPDDHNTSDTDEHLLPM